MRYPSTGRRLTNLEKVLLRLYPQRWRDRYSDEFEAMLAQRQFRLTHVVDIARGALDARLRTLRGKDTARDLTTRLAGLSLLVAGILWVLGIAQRDGYLLPWSPLPTGPYPLTGSDVMRGYIPLLLLLGLACLRLAMDRPASEGGDTRGPSSTPPRPLALTGMLLGLAVYDSTWAIERFLGLPWYTAALQRGAIALGLGVFCLGLGATGIGLLRSRILPAWGGIPLSLGALAMTVFIVATLATGPAAAHQTIYHAGVYVTLVFGLAWVGAGAGLLAGRGRLAGTIRPV